MSKWVFIIEFLCLFSFNHKVKQDPKTLLKQKIRNSHQKILKERYIMRFPESSIGLTCIPMYTPHLFQWHYMNPIRWYLIYIVQHKRVSKTNDSSWHQSRRICKWAYIEKFRFRIDENKDIHECVSKVTEVCKIVVPFIVFIVNKLYCKQRDCNKKTPDIK